jgi:flagellar protein FlaF
MQQSAPEPFVGLPNPAAAAYKAIIRQTESPRDIEHRVFAQVTAALQEASVPGAHFTARIRATHRNRELWQTLACDLADEGNALPAELRAQLLGLAIWVTRETTRVQCDQSSLQDLIDVNISVMEGLQTTAPLDA